MRLPPPEVMATWPAPSANPETRGHALLITQCTISFFASIILALRLYVRIVIIKTAGTDDLLMALAFVFVIATTTTVVLASQLYGWDMHVWDLSEGDLVAGRKASIIAQTLFLFGIGLAKVSILWSYLRFAPLDGWFRKTTYVSLIFVVASMFTFLVVLWTQCIPAQDYWIIVDDRRHERHCGEEGARYLTQSIVTVITDVIVYLLPLPTFFTLRLPAIQRIALVSVFSLGILAIYGSIMRTVKVYEVVYNTWDVTWHGYQMWLWTAVEVNLGVICGCLPCLRPLFRCTSRPRINSTTTLTRACSGGSSSHSTRSSPLTFGGERRKSSDVLTDSLASVRQQQNSPTPLERVLNRYDMNAVMGEKRDSSIDDP